MKKVCVFFLLTLIVSEVNSQQVYFHKLWDKRYGGLKNESNPILVPANNNSLLFAGYSNSGIGGDKIQPNWDTLLINSDYYAVKIDSQGQLQWEKRFGGIISDALWAAGRTNQNGFILGGWSDCGATGDKTEPSCGGADYWIVKIDSTGNKQWDKRFGGNGEDLLNAMHQTNDGGYILGGWSESGISGDRSQPSWGYADYWVVKIDSAGNKQWDKRYGGTDADLLRALIQTSDGGYLLVGVSGSGISGDKTHALLDTNHTPLPDLWLVKIDSLGNKLWDKSLKSVANTIYLPIIKTGDGSFLLGLPGFELLKIDSIANIIWQRNYITGSGILSISITSDNGFLTSGIGMRSDLLGYSTPDRTDDCLGGYNTVVFKFDSLGYKQWDKAIYTTGNDYGGYAIQTSDGCYAVANSSRAGIGGYKTQAAWDSSDDFFIVWFCMDTFVGIDDRQQTQDNSQIQIYPNPFATDLSITLKAPFAGLGAATFTLTNLIGQTIYRREETNLANNYTKMLDLSYLPNGMYLLEVIIDGQRTIKQIIKQ